MQDYRKYNYIKIYDSELLESALDMFRCTSLAFKQMSDQQLEVIMHLEDKYEEFMDMSEQSFWDDNSTQYEITFVRDTRR